MYLQLATRHFNSLENLQRALDDLALHHAFQAYDAQASNLERRQSPSPQQVEELRMIAIGIFDGVRMLGRIKLDILGDNPSFVRPGSVGEPGSQPNDARLQIRNQ